MQPVGTGCTASMSACLQAVVTGIPRSVPRPPSLTCLCPHRFDRCASLPMPLDCRPKHRAQALPKSSLARRRVLSLFGGHKEGVGKTVSTLGTRCNGVTRSSTWLCHPRVISGVACMRGMSRRDATGEGLCVRSLRNLKQYWVPWDTGERGPQQHGAQARVDCSSTVSHTIPYL